MVITLRVGFAQARSLGYLVRGKFPLIAKIITEIFKNWYRKNDRLTGVKYLIMIRREEKNGFC